MLDMAKHLDSRSVLTRVNLGIVQIKGPQASVWWINDRQTNNQPLIAAEFDHDFKKVVTTREAGLEGEGVDRLNIESSW